ncbi:MAG: hypothetical protein ACD_40C00124G0004 [uncultured bacterium]|nr:MAG: hypothetical protein ACD_40C00124G0004 [uncultured bacterium]
MVGHAVENIFFIIANRNIEAKLKETFGAFSKLFLEGTGVFEFDLSIDVNNTTPLDITLKLGLHFGNFSPQVFNNPFAVNGVDKHRDRE